LDILCGFEVVLKTWMGFRPLSSLQLCSTSILPVQCTGFNFRPHLSWNVKMFWQKLNWN